MFRRLVPFLSWLSLVYPAFSQATKPVEAFLWLTDTRLLQFQDPAPASSLNSMPYTFLLSTPKEDFFQAVFKAIRNKQLKAYRDAQLTTPLSFAEIAQQFPVVTLSSKNIRSSTNRLHVGRFESWQLQDSTYLRILRAWILRLEADDYRQNTLSFYLAANEPIPIHLLSMAYDYGADLEQTPTAVMQQQLYNFTWTGAAQLPTALKVPHPTVTTWKKAGAYSIPGIVFKDSSHIPMFSGEELSRYANRQFLQSIGNKLLTEILRKKIRLQYFNLDSEAKPRYVPLNYVQELVLRGQTFSPSQKTAKQPLPELGYATGLAAIEVFGYWKKEHQQLTFIPQKLHLIWSQDSTDNFFGIGFVTIKDIQKRSFVFSNQPLEQVLGQPSLFFWYPIQLNTYPIMYFPDAQKIRCFLEQDSLPIPTARDFFRKEYPLKTPPNCP